MVVEIKIFNRTNFYIVMKKVYHLLSVALLGAMALTSCEEDKVVLRMLSLVSDGSSKRVRLRKRTTR